MPARSSRRGNSANTDGGKPRRAGGSPAARPISRPARAKRVSESIISSTRLPSSRKCSAIAVATYAAFARSLDERSDVAHTITERAMPFSPRISSTNSRTSRPRSPIRAITLISHCAPRASMPSKVLLPTPAGAKMPIRCPSARVVIASITRTPVTIGCSIMRRVIGFGGSAKIGRLSSASIAPRPSIGLPSASITRPSSPSPTGTDNGRCKPITCVARDTSDNCANGDTTACSRVKPITSPCCNSLPCGVRSSHSSPSFRSMPATLISVPTTSAILPVWRTGNSERISRSIAPPSSRRPCSC